MAGEVIEQKIVEWSEKLAELTMEHAPEAWELALDVVRVGALSHFVLAAALLVLSFPSYKIWRWCVKRYHDENKKDIRDDDVQVSCQIGGVVTGVASGLFLFLGILMFFDIWAWFGIFWPEVVMARKVLEGVL